MSALHFERTAAMQPGAVLTKRFMSSHPISLQVGQSCSPYCTEVCLCQ